MSVSGLCEKCGTREVTDGCDRCGRLVCERHYDERTGLCTKCAGEVTGIPTPDRDRDPNRGRDGDDGPDGVDTYRY